MNVPGLTGLERTDHSQKYGLLVHSVSGWTQRDRFSPFPVALLVRTAAPSLRWCWMRVAWQTQSQQKAEARLAEAGLDVLHTTHDESCGILKLERPQWIRTVGYRFCILWDKSGQRWPRTVSVHPGLWTNRRFDTCDPCFEGGACQKVLLKSKQRVFA